MIPRAVVRSLNSEPACSKSLTFSIPPFTPHWAQLSKPSIDLLALLLLLHGIEVQRARDKRKRTLETKQTTGWTTERTMASAVRSISSSRDEEEFGDNNLPLWEGTEVGEGPLGRCGHAMLPPTRSALTAAATLASSLQAGLLGLGTCCLTRLYCGWPPDTTILGSYWTIYVYCCWEAALHSPRSLDSLVPMESVVVQNRDEQSVLGASTTPSTNSQ